MKRIFIAALVAATLLLGMVVSNTPTNTIAAQAFSVPMARTTSASPLRYAQDIADAGVSVGGIGASLAGGAAVAVAVAARSSSSSSSGGGSSSGGSSSGGSSSSGGCVILGRGNVASPNDCEPK